MKQKSGMAILEEMVKIILNHGPGHVTLGNVLMRWDGQRLSWNIPPYEWNIDEVCASLMQYARIYPEVEEIAIFAEAVSKL